MDFTLIPFLADRAPDTGGAGCSDGPAASAPGARVAGPSDLALGGQISRRGDRLLLRYALHDPRGQVRLAPASACPARRDALWSRTCFEAFLARPGHRSYWELNLAPSGDWNVYQLQDYRQGLTPEPAISALPFRIERHGGGLDLELEFDLRPLLEAGTPLELGITAVLELQEGDLSYWALAHPGPEADFHRREAFLLKL